MRTELPFQSAASEPSRLVTSLPLLLPGPGVPAHGPVPQAGGAVLDPLVAAETAAIRVSTDAVAGNVGVLRREVASAGQSDARSGWLESMARTVAMVRELFAVAVPAILLALMVHLFLAQATIVYGQSMEPNLSPYQRLIVEKFSYRVRPPQRNEIVVVDLPQLDDMLVKRVVGLPGETIAVQQGLVYVNGAPLMEPFPHDLGDADMPPMTLGSSQLFVLGDNRDNSNDSRIFGPVEQQRILGRVWMRYWPLNRLTIF